VLTHRNVYVLWVNTKEDDAGQEGHFCGMKTRYSFGVIEEEKEWYSEAPKRHQYKHLGFDPATFRDQGVGGSNPLSPTI